MVNKTMPLTDPTIGPLDPGPLILEHPLNRRAWVRFPWLAEMRARLFDPEMYSYRRVKVVNFSLGGAALLMEGPTRKGAALCMEVEHARQCCTLPVRVRHLGRSLRGWLHGCAFPLPLGADEMRAFLGQISSNAADAE
jgi:hypothetical protein